MSVCVSEFNSLSELNSLFESLSAWVVVSDSINVLWCISMFQRKLRGLCNIETITGFHSRDQLPCFSTETKP